MKLWTGSPASVLLLRAFSSARSERRAGATMDARRASAFLLIVTLQKIHVIEPHVAAVGFVHNEDGRRSMLRNLTIEEYRAERAARAAVQTT